MGIDGMIHDLTTTRPLAMGLDEKAVQAVTTWQFQPGLKDGEPVAVLSNIEINFRLGDDPRSISWHLARVEFLPPRAHRGRYRRMPRLSKPPGTDTQRRVCHSRSTNKAFPQTSRSKLLQTRAGLAM